MHILIVDEDTEQAEFTAQKFSKAGFQAQVAHSFNEAEQALSEHDFVAVLADHKTTQAQGTSLLEQLRIRDPETPCCAIMTTQNDISIDSMMDMGACAIYTKPFSQSRIINELHRLIRPRSKRWAQIKGSRSARPTGIFEVRIESYETAEKSGRIALGHGGVFIHLSGGDFPSEGDIIRLALDFQTGSLPRIEGVGIVRWVRRGNAQGLPAGCGVEFLEIPARYRNKLQEAISTLDTVAFIPKKTS